MEETSNSRELAIQKAVRIFREVTARPPVENKDITTVLEIASFLIKKKETVLTYSRETGEVVQEPDRFIDCRHDPVMRY